MNRDTIHLRTGILLAFSIRKHFDCYFCRLTVIHFFLSTTIYHRLKLCAILQTARERVAKTTLILLTLILLTPCVSHLRQSSSQRLATIMIEVREKM